jgi:hypothetical protein
MSGAVSSFCSKSWNIPQNHHKTFHVSLCLDLSDICIKTKTEAFNVWRRLFFPLKILEYTSKTVKEDNDVSLCLLLPKRSIEK